MNSLSILKFCFYMWSCLIVSTYARTVPPSLSSSNNDADSLQHITSSEGTYSLSTSPSFSSTSNSDTDSLQQITSSEEIADINVYALRIEKGWNSVEDGLLYIYSDEPYIIRLIGKEFGTRQLSLALTTTAASKGTPCNDLRSTDIFPSKEVKENTALFDLTLSKSAQPHFICIREENKTAGGKSQFVHLGKDEWMTIGLKEVETDTLPLWLQIVIAVVLLGFSGLFSGLNLGLMSLDQTELNIMIASGTDKEKKYAKTICPLRKRGNFLLCTILLANVLVNNSLALLVDGLLGNGVSSILGATLAIVLFGEIVPQAICSRHGLAVGAHTAWLTKFFMLVTFPLSFPISLILDRILGEEMGYVYNRDRLRELFKQTEKDIDLVVEEVNIIKGALELSKKTVGNIMTKIEDVFMVEKNSVLDFETMTDIIDSGYTRIPIYEKDRSNIVALLNTKDLAFVYPDFKIPLSNVTKFYHHTPLFYFEDVRLDVILKDFKKGGSHMAMVQHVISDGPGDPFYQVVGLVTLEDIIEEIIQAEIYDEFDIITDERIRHQHAIGQKDYSIFNIPTNSNLPRLTPQLQLASFQFLSGNLAPFRAPHMSECILYKLMTQNAVVEYKIKSDQPHFLYQHGKPSDYFVLIVQGRVLVQSGMENLTYEAGSFSYFGLQALLVKSDPAQETNAQDQVCLLKSVENHESESSRKDLQQPSSSSQKNEKSKSFTLETAIVSATGPFIPDYTVRALSNLQYLKISRDQYLIALMASQLDNELQQENVGKPEEASHSIPETCMDCKEHISNKECSKL